MLDTGREAIPGLGRDSEQHERLRHVLADPLGQPGLAFTHNRPLARGPEALAHPMPARWYARTLVREFERSGVSMVFAGHLHRHETWARRGVTYVVAGEGKAGATWDPQMAVADLQGGRSPLHFTSIWQARDGPSRGRARLCWDAT